MGKKLTPRDALVPQVRNLPDVNAEIVQHAKQPGLVLFFGTYIPDVNLHSEQYPLTHKDGHNLAHELKFVRDSGQFLVQFMN